MEVFTGPYCLAGHTFAVRGGTAHVAEVCCRNGQPLLFAPRTLLWRDAELRMAPASIATNHGGEPGICVSVTGSGRLACTPSEPGQVFMLYLPPDRSISVRPDRWLCAAALHRQPQHADTGIHLDRFESAGEEGLLLVWAAGSAYELMLEADDVLHLHPSALLYAANEVGIAQPDPRTYSAAPSGSFLRCTGPGLLAVQTGNLVRGWP